MTQQNFTSNHYSDAEGNPAGGTTYGPGFTIAWQNGPLGRGENRIKPNGAFVETIINAAKDRIEMYQNSGFACPENDAALKCLEEAVGHLNARTSRRDSEGVEGTYEKDQTPA